MPSTVQPVVLSEAMAVRALGDAAFYAKLPEFSSLKRQRQAIDARNAAGGCGGCRKQTLHHTLFRTFVDMASSLDANARQRFRQYFGAGSMMVNTVDPRTNQVRVQLL